uniref:E3 ubiquitin-protein ligase n=1 Tax=Steinernema glaseri TaxID=37863 RepID=A0A1I7YCP8_9BILA
MPNAQLIHVSCRVRHGSRPPVLTDHSAIRIDRVYRRCCDAVRENDADGRVRHIAAAKRSRLAVAARVFRRRGTPPPPADRRLATVFLAIKTPSCSDLMIDKFTQPVNNEDWLRTTERFYEHVSTECPLIFAPKGDVDREAHDQYDESKINASLIRPVALMLCGQNVELENNQVSLSLLNDIAGLDSAGRRPGQLCGHVFKKGEATYSCKECASDNTCVLCDKCFRKSPHVSHKYKMFTSQGGGYCDCGDEEAWKKDYACLLHTKEPQPGDENLRLFSELPFALKDRLTRVCRIVLRYAIGCLCHEDTEVLPPFLKKATNNELPYQTILFNDETHTYDAVIRALELAIHCSNNTAMLLATLVDREGRTSVKAGSKEICERVKNDIQRRTQKDSNRRTQKKGPLDVKVYDSNLVAHQMYSSRLINWLTRQINNFPPLAEIIGNVLLHTIIDDSHDLLLSPVSQENRKKRRKKRDDSEEYVLVSPDAMVESEQLSDLTIVSSSSSSRGNTPESSSGSESDRLSLVVKMMIKDRRLWKSARLNFHQMLMATVLMDIEQKKLFSKQFIKLYKQLYNDFIDDDHDHGVSIVAMTVQFFTVTTVARELISVDDALKTVFEVLIEHCRGYVKVSQFNPDIQHLDFSSFGFPAVLKRALFILKDAEYLLTCVPKPNEWTDALRKGFITGVTMFVDFLAMMQGMDEVRRQSVEHQLFESEWETGFNIQIRVQEATSLILAWAAVDPEVHRAVFNLVLKRVEAVIRKHSEFSKKRDRSLYEYRTKSYEFDVSKGVISIHQSLWRLLAGLFGATPEVLKHVVVESNDSNEAWMETDQDDSKINLKGKRAMLMEMSLRVMVLSAQTAANLWRRNGFSLVNQIHNYFSPLCRSEMFDRDILALQVGAALSTPETFLIRLIDRFGLMRWADPTASEEQSAPPTPTTRAVPLVEEIRPAVVVNFGTTAGATVRANVVPVPPQPQQTPAATMEESSKIIVTMAEEFLHLVIIICMERYGPGVGMTSRKDMLKHEIVHLLCAGPMQFSKIDKVIPDDPLSDNIVIEQAVMEVGDFTKPSKSSAGVFTLKKELRKRYNAFYYHYSRSDISAAEQHQQKERSKEPLEIAACPPPTPPAFSPFFSSIPQLLKSPLLLKVMKLCLDRHAKRNRFSSDGLLHRVLFVLGMGLNEQERSMDVPDGELFDFITAAKEEGIRQSLQSLVGKQESHSHANLLMWTVKKFDDLEKRASGAMEVDEKPEPASTDRVDSGAADKARRRAAMAAKMRANAMGQMNKMAKSFMSQHKDIVETAEGADKARSKKGVSFMDDDIEYSQISEDNKFPVCCGPEKTEVEHITPRRARCMLCQEEEEMCDTSRPIVCAAYVQESALFNQRGHAQLPNYGPVFVPVTMDRGLDMSTCAHTMHHDCYINHTESLFARERSRPRNQMAINQRMIDIEEREYQCPLCKRLSNCAIPLMPALKLFKLKGFSQDRPTTNESFEDWLTNIADLITKPITAIGPMPTAHKPVKSHSRKRSHSERSLLDLVKSENREQQKVSLAEQSVLSTSVPSASTLSLLMGEADPAAAARADAAVNRTVEMVLGEGSAGEPGSRAASLSVNDVDMADSGSVTSGPSRGDSTANLLSLPSNIFHKIKCMLPTKLPKDNVPSGFISWDMIKAFIKNLPAVQTSHQVTDNQKNYLEFTTAIAGTTFVLRELSAILREENKPLFGAFNTRQRDCLNAVSRLAVLVPFNCRTALLRLVVSRAFGALLAVPEKYDHMASWTGPVYPTTPFAETSAALNSTFNLNYDPMEVGPYSPTSPQSPPHSAASGGSASAHRGITSPFAPPPSVSETLMNQLKTNVSVHHVDMLSLAVELMMTIGYMWLDGRQVLHTHNRQDNTQKIADGSLDELYALRLTLLAHICQVMGGFRDGEPDASLEESDAEKALNARITELYRLACPGEDLRDARRLRILLHEAIVDFLRPIAILYNSITLIPPPEALKDPSLDEFEPLLRYMGLSHRFMDLIEGQFVERLFANWGKYYPQPDRQVPRPVQLPIRLNRLIDLPNDITDVVNMAVNYRCPSVRAEELATACPTMCLVCGTILCSQSYCCQQTIGKEAVGACTFHTKSCSGSGGIFLRLRDSQLLILANRSRGMLKPAPYVDEFGETDQGFRRGNPLHLNKELYAKIQQLWLHQRITEEVVSQYDINYRYVTMEWQHF